MSEGNDPNERRCPRSLQDVLKFCTEYTKVEDAPDPSNFEPMSEERKKFLKEAIDSMMGNDPIKILLQHIQTLLDSQKSLEDHELALDEITEYCEDIDLANDFQKIGGCHLLPRLLLHGAESLQWRTAGLIATLTQNNPYSQKVVAEAGLLPILLQKMDSDVQSERVRVKCLYAVSCLVRGNEDVEKEFIRLDGFSYVLRCMQTDIDKLRVKSAFVIASFCAEQPHVRDTLCDMGMVEQVVGLLQSTDHSPFHEHLLRALVGLAGEHERARAECCRPEFRLRKLLEQRCQLLKDKPEFEEELEYVKQLKHILDYNRVPVETSSVDR